MNVYAPNVEFSRLRSGKKRKFNAVAQIITNRTIPQKIMRVLEVVGLVGAIYIAEGNLCSNPQVVITESNPALRLVVDKKGRTLQVIK